MERLNLGKIIGTYDAKFDRSKYILKVNTQIFFKYNNGDTVEMYQDSFEEYVYGPNYNNDLNKILYHFAYGVLYTYLVSDEKASVARDKRLAFGFVVLDAPLTYFEVSKAICFPINKYYEL